MKLLGRDVLVTLPTSLEVSDVMLVLETLTPLDLSLVRHACLGDVTGDLTHFPLWPRKAAWHSDITNAITQCATD